MSFRTLQRVVYTLVVSAVATVLAGWALTLGPVRAALPASAVTWVASLLLVVPLGIHAVFLVVQALPGGRRIVPLRLTRSPDAWLLIFVTTMLAPKEQLAAWAVPTIAAGESGRSLSLIVAVFAIVARVYQLNRGAALGVTPGPDPVAR